MTLSSLDGDGAQQWGGGELNNTRYLEYAVYKFHCRFLF